MTLESSISHHEHAGAISPAKRLNMNRMGLWLFFLSEIFLFGGMFIARFYLWGATRPHLNQTLGLAVTVILLISSFYMNRAEMAMAHDDRPEFLRSIALTILLGLGFLVGVVFMEWPTAIAEGITPWGDVYGAILFFMTGMHAFHVLTGVIMLLIVAYLGWKGHFNAQKHWGVEAAAIYWHFVDVVWVFFYPALYLMGTAVMAH